LAAASGARVVEMVWEDLSPDRIVTMEAVENAVTTDLAIGGSTNAIIHLVAIAGRAGLTLDLRRFDELSRRTPMLADIRPAGRFLMEDFYYAGGLRALLWEIRDLLHLDCLTVSGQTLGEHLQGMEANNREVIRARDNPLSPEGGTAVLYGNLAPDGAVIKTVAASPHLLRHSGPAVVFDDYNDLSARIEDAELAVTADSVLILRNAGPQGGPGMPEWGMLPIPSKLLREGVRDMVRISDARMSGTSYGTCVLHVSPESFVGGPLALVEDGDLVELDVPARRLWLHVADDELARRSAKWVRPTTVAGRGFGALYGSCVSQAHEGCDFDFLQCGPPVAEPEIH
jgi:dihydroxy-acid dehydratase